MAGEANITVIGNLGADADIRVTSNGKNVCSFSIANTPRKQVNNEWVDGETVWYRVFVWGRPASGAVSFVKGDRVVVTGRLSLSRYTGSDGVERTSLDIDADGVGLIPKATDFVPAPKNRSDEEPVADDFPF